MKAAIFVKPGEVTVREVPKPKICKPTDAIIKIIRSCVCGSDLWYYRGLMPHADNSFTTGHEALGIVDEVGSDVTSIKPGDFVICPFTHGCGHCIACVSGLTATASTALTKTRRTGEEATKHSTCAS